MTIKKRKGFFLFLNGESTTPRTAFATQLRYRYYPPQIRRKNNNMTIEKWNG